MATERQCHSSRVVASEMRAALQIKGPPSDLKLQVLTATTMLVTTIAKVLHWVCWT